MNDTEPNIYNSYDLTELVESDEITAQEEAFMRGYDEDDEEDWDQEE